VKVWTAGPVMILIPIISLAIIIITESGTAIDIAGVLNGLIICGLFGYIKKSVSEYNTLIKSEIFPKIINFFGNFNCLETNTSFNLNKYKKFDILPFYLHSYCEDHIKGCSKTVGIELFEATLERKIGKGNKKVVFHGLIIKLNVSKNFK
jgi:hypothetical protein